MQADPTTVRVDVDVAGLPLVMQLGLAARDVVDRAVPLGTEAGADGLSDPSDSLVVVEVALLGALRLALAPLLPGVARCIVCDDVGIVDPRGCAACGLRSTS